MDRKVILIADVKGVGHKNDVVRVSVGYAANYLLPQHLATDATPDRVAALGKQKLAVSLGKNVALTRAQELAEKLAGQSITVRAKATPQGRLYGAITPDEIATAIGTQLGIPVDKKTVVTDEPIRALGVYAVLMKLNSQVSVTVSVTVTEAV
jgi:large subunit ribosomal protein L9